VATGPGPTRAGVGSLRPAVPYLGMIGRQTARHLAQVFGVRLELAHIRRAETGLNVGQGLLHGSLAADDLLGKALQAVHHVHHVLGDERQAPGDRQDRLQDVAAHTDVLAGQGVQGGGGVGQLQGHFLDQVHHPGVLFDHAAYLIQ
jgi:hypothetical protein